MRVITGLARGRRLRALEGDAVRPTTDKVKEAVFSAIQFDIEGRRVLDLFAGSGQLGIEALSRGAVSATFVDNSAQSVEVVRDNLKSVDFLQNSKVVKSDFASFLLTTREEYDIAFLDPPYGAGLIQNAVEMLPRVMSEYGVIVCEHPINETMPESIGSFTVQKVYKYGKIAVTIYRK